MVFVPSHQLPDQGQGVYFTPLIQIFSSNADQREVSNIPAQPNSIVTVLQLEYVMKNFRLKCFAFAHQFTIPLKCLYSEHTFFILAPRKG